MGINWFSDLPVLLNMSVTGAIVTLFVLALRLVLKRAPKKIVSLLWLIVLFRLLCPIAPESGVSLMGAVERQSAAFTAERPAEQPVSQPQPAQSAHAVSEPAETAVTASQSAPVQQNAAARSSEPAAARSSEPVAAEPVPPEKRPLSASGWMKLIWAGGAAVMLGWSMVSLLRLRRKLIGAVKLRENLYLADHISSPFVMGVVKPKIYLPSSVSEREQDYIILHEKTHIRRLDHVVKLLLFAALCIHWFNPFVWLAFVLAGQDMEMACDEAVLKMRGAEIRADYSESLLKLATGHRFFAGAPLAFGEGDPKHRIRRVLSWKKPAVWLIVLAAVAAIAAAVLLGTNPAAFDDAAQGAYAAAELLYEAPDYRGAAPLQELPRYVLDQDGVLFELRGTDTQTNERIGQMEKISLSTGRLCAMFSPGSAKAYASMAGVKAVRRVDTDEQKFYLLLQRKNDCLMAVGYGEGESSRIRWLFRLDRIGRGWPIEAQIMMDEQLENVSVFTMYNSASMPFVLYGYQYDGGMGVAGFRFNDAQEPTKKVWNVSFRDQDIYNITTAKREDCDHGFTVVLSDNEKLSRVTVQYKDTLLTQDVTGFPVMCVFEWPAPYAQEEDFHPELHYYDADGNELEPTGTAQETPEQSTWTEGRSLTQTELDAWNERLQFAFPDPEHDGEFAVNPMCLFFYCSFDRPENIDLERFCRYFQEDREPITEREFSLLKQDPYWPFDMDAQSAADLPLPIHRHPASDIDAMLRKYTDIGLRDLQQTPESLPDLLYLPEFDAYYNFTSDAGLAGFTCTSGWQYGDVVTLFGSSLYHTQSTLVLWEKDGQIRFLSHEVTETAVRETPISGCFDGVTVGMTAEELAALGYDVSEAEGTVAGFMAYDPDEIVLEKDFLDLGRRKLRKTFRLTDGKLEPTSSAWLVADRPKLTLKRELNVFEGTAMRERRTLLPGETITILQAEPTVTGWRIFYALWPEPYAWDCDGYFEAQSPDGNGWLIIDGISASRVFENIFDGGIGAYLSNGVKLGMTVDEVMALTGEFELQAESGGLGAYGTQDDQQYSFWRDDDGECWLKSMKLRDFEKTGVTAGEAGLAPGQTLPEVLEKLGLAPDTEIPAAGAQKQIGGISMSADRQYLTVSVKEQAYDVIVSLIKDGEGYTVYLVTIRR